MYVDEFYWNAIDECSYHASQAKTGANFSLSFTGFPRFSCDAQRVNRPWGEVARLLEMLVLADVAEAVLVDKHTDLDEFGHLLAEMRKLKCRPGSTVLLDSIDALYARAISAGAVGGRLLGSRRRFGWRFS